MDSTTIQALRKIRDATDSSGGAKYPSFMEPNMKAWERKGWIERHRGNGDTLIARITEAGRTKLIGTQ